MKITTELTDMAVLHEIGERLERRRIDAGLTQAQLAEEAGISSAPWSGSRRATALTLSCYCAFCGC